MESTMGHVTQNDVKALYDNASPARRSILAQKIGHDLKSGELSESEFDLAVAICQKLAQDVEVTVRQTLSESVKSCQDIPKELAVKLANDILDVSLPVIEYSDVLDDDDLISLVRSDDLLRQIAITKRENISPAVCQTLVSECREYVVDSLLKNEGADLQEDSYDTVLERFEHSPTIHSTMAHRENLPGNVVDKMLYVVSDQLKAYLITHHPVSPLLAEKMILESQEDAKRRLMNNPLSTRDTQEIINELARKEKLTIGLIFRSLEIGDRSFFEHALAHRTGIPVSSAQILIKDPGEKGFSALYKKAELPQADYNDIKFMVDAEYHGARTHARATAKDANTGAGDDPDNWVNGTTAQPKKKWRLF